MNVKVFLKRQIRIITTVCLQLHKELTGYSRQGLNVVETHLTAVHHRLHLHTSTAGYTATGPSFSKGGQHYPLDKINVFSLGIAILLVPLILITVILIIIMPYGDFFQL